MSLRFRFASGYVRALLIALAFSLTGCVGATEDTAESAAQEDDAAFDAVPALELGSSEQALSIAEIAAGVVDADFCWMDSYGRGVGTVPDACPGEEKNGALCYPRCANGYYGVGPVCWQHCPAGFRDDGAACWVDSHIFSGDNSQCPWYDVCGLTLAPGCSTCPAGYANDGCTCRRDAQMFYKSSYGRGAGRPMACNPSLEFDAGLCYNSCRAGYDGVGPVCWGLCPAQAPVACGAGCAVTQAECASRIISQISTTLEMAGNIAAAAVSFGTSAAVKYVTSVSMSEAAKAALKQQIKDELIDQGRELAEHVLEQVAVAGVNAAQGKAIDYASFDPTGVAAMVEAFHAPYCSALVQSNRARGKPTSQSSTDEGGVSARAVDGNTNGNWGAGSVTHTATSSRPWWSVDLQQTISVDKVVIWNRTDCCSSRLSNFNVELRDATGATIQTRTITGVAGQKTVVDFAGARGQVVRIQLNGSNPLSLAEVEVLGR